MHWVTRRWGALSAFAGDPSSSSSSAEDQLPKGDLLHHKFAVIDGQTVITGSHNWSTAANKNNDETLLVIQNPKVAAHFEREFARLYQNAQLGIPPSLQEKIDEQKKTCR